MAKKKEQVKVEKNVFEPKIAEGYAIYDTSNEVYRDADMEWCDEDQLPEIYDDFEEVKNYIEECDYPENHEIHKIKHIIQVEEVHVRKIVYDLVADKK